MIRFIYIGNQITEGSREFAFFNTVQDKFITINGCETFSSIEEFKEFAQDSTIYDRCASLIPDWYKNNDNPPI